MALEAAASPTLAGPSRVPAQQDSPEQPFAPSYYECAICNEILLDPVVGACGHDFCRGCLEQWRKASEQLRQGAGPRVAMCPICRQPLSEGLGVCHRLKGILESCFPEQLARRRAEAATTATEVKRRSEQFINLQACVVARFHSLLDLHASPGAHLHPQPHLFSVPDISHHPSAAPAGSLQSMDATFLSSWDQDLPQFAAINTNPAFPAPFAQCLAPPGSQPLPPAQLLNSAPAAWAAATSGSSPAPTSSTQVCFEAGAQAPLSWLPASSTTPRQSSGALPHFATPPRLAASSGAATRSQQPGMARLPPLPPRRPAHSSSHSSAGPDATLFTASTARTPPATATVDFSTHAEGLSAQHLHTYPGNALPAQLPSSSSVQSPVDFVLSVMSASIGGQATPALGMPQAVSAPCFPPAPLLRLPQTVVPGVQFPQRVPTNTPDGAAAESVGFFDASPRAFSQPGTMSAPHDVLAAGGARRVASASRVSQDSCLPDAGADFLYGTEPGQFLLSAQRRPLQRRPSEPGCSFGVGADHSLVLVTGETKYTSAIKRMREEDDVADKEGRPRTSAMRRLFPAESSAPRAHHVNRPAGSGPAADAQYLNPQAIRTTPASILDAAAAWQASRSLSSPGCGSVSAPGSAYTTLQSLESVTAEAGQMDSMPCVVTDVAGARATSHPRLCRRRATHDGALGFPPLSSVRAPPPGSSLNSVASTPCGQPQQRWQLPSTPRSVFGMAAACQVMAPPATAAPTEAGSVESMDDDDVPACDPVLATRGSCVLSTVGSAVCLLTAPEQALQVRSASPPPTMPPPPQAGAPSPAVPAVAPSILQFAAPVRTGRRGPLGSDAYSRTCPSTPRAGVREASNPFHDAPDGNSALIAALMLPPAPVVAAPALTPVLTPADMGAAQLWSLQELAAKSLGRPAPPARDWHSREQDKTIRSACSSALASFFSERFQDQLRDQPAGAVFLYVKAIEEHLYFNTATKQEYADLSTLQDRMIKAVEELTSTPS